jgi:tetratricopeptide (TPR) repeat protein
MRFTTRSIDLSVIGDALGVRYVLEGSVRRSGPTVRVSAQLTSIETGVHLWAERFEGQFADIFEMQDTITAAVIGLIEPQIRTAEIARSRRKPPQSLDAYDWYLQALPSIFSGDPSQYSEAMGFLERAIAVEPDYAQAMALLSWAHSERCIWAVDGGAEERTACLEMARRAIEVGGDDPIVLAMASSGHMTGDLAHGLVMSRLALTRNPNSLVVLNSAGEANKHLGYFAEALTCFQRALELSPGAPDNNWSLTGVADSYLGLGAFEDAVAWGSRATHSGRPWWVTWFILAAAHAHLGQLDEASAALGKGLAMRPGKTIARLLGGRPRQPWYENWIEGLLKAGLPS